MVAVDEQEEINFWQSLRESVRAELEQTKRQIGEINLMLDQSQLEVSKLAQKNASVTTHLQQVQGHFDSLPRAEIRAAYDAALDAQQRLFVMRGQVEKLQSDQGHLRKYIQILEKVSLALENNLPTNGPVKPSETVVETVEMMIEAQEAERLRLSRQMHDGPAQALSNFILQTEIAMRLFDVDQSRAREELSNLKQSATSAFQKVRDFIFDLRPMMLDDLGLAPTIKRYVDAFKEHQSTEVQLFVSGVERRLEPYLEVMIFRAIQELLNNAARHSQASLLKVHVDLGDSSIKVTVEDNGRGFDPAILEEPNRMGIKIIKERAEKLGGYLELDSVIGKGTRVFFQVPAT